MSDGSDVTVIIPYYNEQKTIEKTLELIKSQSKQPKKVFLINSSSTDNTSNLINLWIKKNRVKKKYKNIFKKTKYPSTSKNLGIKLSKTKLVAFMDCDINFNKNWLKNQLTYLKKHNLNMVLGSCFLKGKGLLDSCFVAQTWGYSSKVNVIPSSLIKKQMFKRLGFFYSTRAGYDRLWINNLKKNYGEKVGNNYVIRYNKFNHSNSFFTFFKKIFLYSMSSYQIKELSNKNYYLTLILVGIFLLIINTQLFALTFATYLFFRSYIFPIYKSKSIKIFKDYFLSIFILPIVGFGIDLMRISSLILFYLRKVFSVPN